MLAGLMAAAILPLAIFAGYPADRPVVLPLPESVAGAGTPVQLLNGTWKFTMTPPADLALGQVPFSWSSNPLAFYRVEFSEDLVQWTEANGFVPSEGEQTHYVVDLNKLLGYNPDKGFFRIGEL